MMITEENDLRAEIEAALCQSMESIRRAANAGNLTHGDPFHERLWIMAARGYAEASDYVDALGITPMSEPMWLIVVSSVDPMVMGEIQDWVAGRQDTASAMFDFPDLPVSGDLDFRVLFLTPSKETATLFKTFYA